jgi:hypothetical protein
MRVSIPPKRYSSHVALVPSIHEPFGCLEEEMCDTFVEDDANIDPRFVIDGSVVEYMDMIDGFSQIEGDVTLSSRFSLNKGVDLVRVNILVARGFEVH